MSDVTIKPLLQVTFNTEGSFPTARGISTLPAGRLFGEAICFLYNVCVYFIFQGNVVKRGAEAH
jgi:hypothetical protein